MTVSPQAAPTVNGCDDLVQRHSGGGGCQKTNPLSLISVHRLAGANGVGQVDIMKTACSA